MPSKWTNKKSISGYTSPKFLITDEHNIYVRKRYANRNNNNYSWYSYRIYPYSLEIWNISGTKISDAFWNFTLGTRLFWCQTFWCRRSQGPSGISRHLENTISHPDSYTQPPMSKESVHQVHRQLVAIWLE